MGATLSDALHLMWEHDIGVVPVIDRQGHVVGMVTDRDAAMATYLHGRKPGELIVDQTMSATVRSCGPDDAVATAEALMRTGQIRRLPVVDATGRLLGMISLADLALNAGGGIPMTNAHDLVRTLEAIAQPRTKPTVEARG